MPPASEQWSSPEYPGVFVQLFRSVPDVTFYKVLGARCTLHQYAERGAHQSDDLDGKGSLQHPDWQALYCQFQQEHVLGTIPYRWDVPGKYCEATLVQGCFVEPVDILRVNGSLFFEGGISGSEKARIVKSLLQLPEAEALLVAVGLQSRCMLVQETEGEWELLIPHDFLDRARLDERPLCRFRKYPGMPMTASWCAVEAAEALEDDGMSQRQDLEYDWEPWPVEAVMPDRLERLLPNLEVMHMLEASSA